jgi:UDP-glucuronate 4-epimerase
MRILITGSAGFIGSAICHSLVKLGHEIQSVDNFSNYYDVSLKYARVEALLEPLGLKVIDLDISHQIQFDNLVKLFKPDMIINLAAQAGVRLDIHSHYKYIQNNIVGFDNVLVSCLEHKVPYLLYASSSSVYGDSSTTPYSEIESNLRPNSFYGVTKLANELQVKALVKNSSTRARGLRFFTVYGPWGRPDMAYLRMIANVISGANLNIYGDGLIERDFTYIDDVVNSVILLSSEMQNKNFGFNDVVNIGGGRPLSINYLMKIVEELSGKQVIFKRLKSNLNDLNKTVADYSYLKSLIGNIPMYKLEDGIQKTYTWASQPVIARNIKGWIESVN